MRSPGRSLRRRSPVTPGRCCRPSPSRCRRSVSTRSAEAGRDGSPTRPPGSGRPPWTVGTSASSTCPASRACSGSVEGRTAQAVIDWLADRDQAWRDAVQYVAIDMCTIFKSAIRRVLPQATLVVDHFHLVQPANQTLTEVRRRVTVTHRGRRGRKGNREWELRNRLTRSAARMRGEHVDALLDELSNLPRVIGAPITVAWNAKEDLSWTCLPPPGPAQTGNRSAICCTGSTADAPTPTFPNCSA
ncbi:transposase [Streptomyces olivochromogenes]|uniref:transposase n=1 Tax=Streptomyces olivochromogenes TaxID=1963 RepID=UPI003693526A